MINIGHLITNIMQRKCIFQMEEKAFSQSEIRWLACYLASSWLTNFGHGLVVTVVGPTQLYIAKNVGVEKDTINWLWTFGFFGFLVGAVVAGFVFKRYVLIFSMKSSGCTLHIYI